MAPLYALMGLLAGTTPDGAKAPAWEKLYTWSGKGAPRAVWADESGWVAGGPGRIVTGGAGAPEELARPRYSIVAFSGDRAQLFAVGPNQLVLKLEGKQWIEEHFVPDDLLRGPRGAELVERVDTLMVDDKSMPAASGPWLVMVRHPDGTWQELPEVPRQRVLALARAGPAGARPGTCAPGAWSWVGKDRALFSCRDGQAFRFEGGKSAPLPRLPRACRRLERARVRGAESYLLCQGKLFQAQEVGWRRLEAPPGLRDFAVTAHCLYAAAGPAVWRRCER